MIRAPETLPQAMKDAISVDVNHNRLGQLPQHPPPQCLGSISWPLDSRTWPPSMPPTAAHGRSVARWATAQPSAGSSAPTVENGGTRPQYAGNPGKPRAPAKEGQEEPSAPSVTGEVTPRRSTTRIRMAPAISPVSPNIRETVWPQDWLPNPRGRQHPGILPAGFSTDKRRQ